MRTWVIWKRRESSRGRKINADVGVEGGGRGRGMNRIGLTGAKGA